MKRQLQWCGAALLLVSLAAGWAIAQRPGGTTGGGKGKPQVKLPEDKNLIKLHQQFVERAEKLAAQYQQNKELDKAIACYKEILRLVPNYGPAQAAMAKIFSKQISAQKAVFDCMATKGWQDTGIDILAGKPLVIVAKGSWKLRMEYPVTADGIEIPRELRRFNLGSLIGIIVPEGQTLNPKLEAPPDSRDDVKPVAAAQPPAEGEQQPPPGQQPPAEEVEQQDNNGEAPAAGAPAAEPPAAASGNDQRTPFSGRDDDEKEDDKPRPFYIGKLAELVPSKSGRLYVRIYDADPDDNVGKVTIQINGTFGKK